MPLTPEQIAAMDSTLQGGLDANTMAKMDAVVGGEPSRFGQEKAYMVDKIKSGQFPSVFDMIGAEGNIVGGTVNDAVGAVVAPVLKAAGHLVPQFVEDAAKYVATPAINAVGRGVDSFSQSSPEAAHLIKGYGNFALATPTVDLAARGVAKAPDAMSKLKDEFQARKLAKVQEVVLPKQTPAEIERTALKRSTGGLLNKQVYTPDPYEAEMIKTAAEVGVKPSAPLADNIQIINAANIKEAQQLRFALEKANVQIAPEALNKAGVSIAEKIAANPLVDENGATVRKILEAAQRAVDSNPKTASGLLQARQDFDKAITKFQPSAFDVDAPATAFRFSKDQVRQGFNQLIEESVPDAGVKASLAKQSQMYRAIENMAGKLSQQSPGMKPLKGDNRISRFFDTKTGKALKYGTGAAAVGGGGAAAVNSLGAK